MLSDERVLLGNLMKRKEEFISVYISKNWTYLRLMFLVLAKMTLLAYLSSAYSRTSDPIIRRSSRSFIRISYLDDNKFRTTDKEAEKAIFRA
jgi:hypothetical protein